MINSLTGLRFIAAAIVVFAHAGNLAVDGNIGFGRLAANAVAFFFVLSGFILTYVYSDRAEGFKLSNFYVARFARIWPLHLLCFAFAFGFQWYYQGFYWNPTSIRRMISNVLLIHSWMPEYKAAYWFNGPSWSISTEFAFYLLFPVLLYFSRKSSKTLLAAVVGFTAIALIIMQYAVNTGSLPVGHGTYYVYVNPLFRVFDFVVGIVTGRIYLARKDKWGTSVSMLSELAGIGLLVFGGWFVIYRLDVLLRGLDVGGTQVIGYWLHNGGGMVLIYATLIYVFARSAGPVEKTLSHPVSVYLGEISFAFYLIQMPVIYFVENVIEDAVLPGTLIFSAVVIISLSAAALLHGYVEMPLRNGIVGLWKRGNESAAWIVGKTWLGELQSPITYWSLACVVLMGGALIFEANNSREKTIREQVALLWEVSTENSSAPVTFGDQAILRSMVIQEDRGSIVIRLLWEKLEGWNRNRFVHLTDSEGKILFHGAMAFEIFQEAAVGELIIDECVIPPERLPGVETIGIGFHSKENGTVMVDSGVRAMGGRRLEIAKMEDGEPKLISQKSESEGPRNNNPSSVVDPD